MWMKLEDAVSGLYLDKCDMERRKLHKLGQSRTRREKCLNGCLFTAFMIIIVILPIALFSTLNPSKVLNNATSGIKSIFICLNLLIGVISVQLIAQTLNQGSYVYNLFQVQNPRIVALTENEFEALKQYNTNIDHNSRSQFQKVILPTSSDNSWTISPPNFHLLQNDILDDNIIIYISALWSFNRYLSISYIS